MNKPFETRLLINGRFVDGAAGRKSPLLNPATEETWCEVAAAEVADAERAVEGALHAFEKSWREEAPGRRSEILYGITRLIREHAEELAQLEMRCIGKPIADAREEVELGARIFEYYAGAVSHLCGETIPVAKAGFDFTLRQPLGVVVAIVPWNFPFPITAAKVAPALAAGNTVVLKPASLTPLSALKLGALALEAGLPPGALQVIAGSGQAIGDALVQHRSVRKISFTGSTAVGVRVMQMAAAGMKRVSLELGGKSPNIIFADADLEQAASSSPMSVFANCGQDCCARSRIFVERPAFDAFVEKFVQATQALIVGDPSRPETQIGPLSSPRQRESVEAFLDGAKKAGRTLACGGTRPSGRGCYLSPAVVLGCETTDEIWREEVFGPVVCIRPFEDEDTMLREVNASPYGLSGSLWTNDLRRALRVARRVESGVLSVNCHSSVHVEAPFGGFKLSGIGRERGMAGLESYTELKNVFIAP